MQVHPKNARRYAARATFSLRRVEPIQAIIMRRLTCMINSALMRMRRLTGATKRLLRMDYVWRKKASAPRRLPRFTKYWSKTRAPIGGANCSGITRLDLTPHGCWRKTRSGNLLLPSMTNSQQREAAGAKKQQRVLPIFAWNISSGRINRKESMAENLGFLSQIDGLINLREIRSRITMRP